MMRRTLALLVLRQHSPGRPSRPLSRFCRLVKLDGVGHAVVEGAGGEVAGDSLVVILESVDGFGGGGEEVGVVDGYVR